MNHLINHKLEIKVNGKLVPEIMWIKDIVPTEKADGIKLETKSDGTVALTVDKSKPQNSGKYTLIVENKLGEVRASTDVNVQKGPVISEKLPEKLEVVAVKPLTLTAKVD